MAKKTMFEVDRQGLLKVLGDKELGLIIRELVQNAWDQNVTFCKISLTPHSKGHHLLTVEDDDPEGFKDLSHAYTFFAESYKKDDPSKRGRFNVGEKWVIALCDHATIESTTGTIEFNPADGTREEFPRRKRERGSKFTGVINLTRKDYEDVERAIRMLAPPPEVETYFNGEKLETRSPLKMTNVKLPTVIADATGHLRPTARYTNVLIYEPLAGEKPHIFEMGIPVVESGDRWHVDVQQKVPLTLDRDNLPPAYVRQLRAAVVNAMYNHLTEETAAEKWVDHAFEDPSISHTAIKVVLDKRFTENRAVADPSDREAEKRIAGDGGVIIPSTAFSRAAWDNIRRTTKEDARWGVLPAGKLAPSPKPFSDDPNAPELKTISPSEYTPDHEQFIKYARMLARELMDAEITVHIANDFSWPFGGSYGGRVLTANQGRLGKAWFSRLDTEVDAFLIHEFGHHYESDHFSAGYHRALTKLGAKLTKLALEKPEVFEPYKENMRERV